MATYRAAVVGLSGIAASPRQAAPDPALGVAMPHSHVAAYATVPSTEVVAVCDLLPEMLDRFEREWGGELPQVRPYTDYKTMLQDERIDLLSVATPDHRHAQIVVDAVEAGVRGIFCEKPIATTLADADRMIAACRRHNVPLLVDHTRRWYPEFAEARRRIREGAIGSLQRIVATLGGPRAMLFRNGTHLIDCVCYFAESEPAWVWGELDDPQRAHAPRYTGDGGRDPATDPGGSGYVHFTNGARGFINASKATMPNFELDLVGETGRIRIGTHVAEHWHALPGGGMAASRLHPPPTTRGDMVAAVEELIHLVEHGGRGTSTGEDARQVLSILLGILQSNARGSAPVTFPIEDV